MHLKRLNAMAGKINHLSAEQERAIAEMQAIQAHLSRLQPRLNGQGLPLASPSLDVKRAAIASAEVDSQGNILLSYRTVNPSQGPQSAAHPRPNSEAADLAAHLRATYGPAAAVPGGWRALAADVLAVGQEPAQLVARLGQATWEMAQGLTRFALSGATQPPGAPPRPPVRPAPPSHTSRPPRRQLSSAGRVWRADRGPVLDPMEYVRVCSTLRDKSP